MSRSRILIVLLLLGAVQWLYASPDSQSSGPLLPGYQSALAGEVLVYHSPQPDVGTSLLVRSLDSRRFIQWQTAPVPEQEKSPFVSFVWMFGIDVNSDSHPFVLAVNDRVSFRFENPLSTEPRTWKVKGGDGAELVFRATMVDRHGDLMGYASLKLPRSMLNLGKSQIIKVTGASAGSRSWYMTFQHPVSESIQIFPRDALLRNNGKPLQVLRLNAVHLGEKQKSLISIHSGTGVYKKSIDLKYGFNAIRLTVPQVRQKSELKVSIKTGKRPPLRRNLTLEPVRPWTVYFVQHTHTDIGYTRPQTEILPEHLRYIDYALDFCDLTDAYPDDARFRWTCESSWAVRQYLAMRPKKQIERLKRRVKEGRIELTAMFSNMSDIMDEASSAAQLLPVRRFRDMGFPVRLAMQNDVNGIAWCLADYFAGAGIDYLVMGQHGHRALIPFDKPTLFHWQSPSGKSVLAFRAEHYMTGNVLGIHHGDTKKLEPALLRYLDQLETKGYAYDRIALQYSGYVTDNSPPGLTGSQVIKQWNEIYQWPKLRSATASEFMDYMSARHGSVLPVYRRAWPDWWSDGFGSAARETGAIRVTHAGMQANQGLLSMAALLGARVSQDTLQRITHIQDAMLFYDEHTFGAAESISDPTSENSMVQWMEKSAYAWEAVKKSRMLREEAMGLLTPYLPRAAKATIAVFNTLNWSRSGVAEIYIDHEIISPGKAFRILDPMGKPIAVQPLSSRNDGTYWALRVEDIPSLGYKIYRIHTGKGDRGGGRPTIKTGSFSGVMENSFYRLVIDKEKGSIKSLLDKETGGELADSRSRWQLGQFIYERLTTRGELNAKTLHETPRRTPLHDIFIDGLTQGPIWDSLRLHGQAPGCADEKGVYYEIRLFHHEKRVEFHFGMRKLPVTEPESVYVAFPLQMPGGQLMFEERGGMVRPGKDQLEGTSSDWNVLQHVAVVRGPEGQILFSSPQTPLVHLGGINLGKFQYISKPEQSHIFSWVLNNYWVTNFRASQQGELKWHYAITSTKDPSNSAAVKFGWGNSVPFPARVLPPGRPANQIAQVKKFPAVIGSTRRVIGPTCRVVLKLETPGLLLVKAGPALEGKAITLHLREVNGKRAELDVGALLKKNQVKAVWEVDVLENNPRSLIGSLLFEPYEVKFIRLDL